MSALVRTVLALAVLVAACAGEENRTPDAQPAPDVTVFRGGAFDQLPRYPRSNELAPAKETAGVVAQSFAVRNAEPRQIVDFYAERLDGWEVVEPVRQVGDEAFRGRWERDGQHLQVSTRPAPAVDVQPPTPEPPTAQYSLQLGPPQAFP